MKKSQYKFYLISKAITDSVKVLGEGRQKSLELTNVKLPDIQTLGEARMQGRRTGAVSEVSGVVIEMPFVKSIPSFFELLRKGTSIDEIEIQATTMHESKSGKTAVPKTLYNLKIHNARVIYGSVMVTSVSDITPSDYISGCFIIKGDEYSLDQTEYDLNNSNKKGKSGINISTVKSASKVS